MTPEQRRQRAAFLREQPTLWLLMLYAVGFFGCSVVADLLPWWTSGPTLTPLGRYLMPLSVVLPMWPGVRRWARRVSDGQPD